MMSAGLESDICGGTLGYIAGRFQRVDLGMRFSGQCVPAFANDFTVSHDDAANHWIGMRAVATALSKLQSALHVHIISGVEIRHLVTYPVTVYLVFLPSSSGSSDICSRLAAASEIRCRRLISSSNSVTS